MVITIFKKVSAISSEGL